MVAARPKLGHWVYARVTARIMASCAAATFVAIAPASAQAQMSIPGQFAVGGNGAATYAIPIQTPPGVSGVEPQLGLNYSSQGGNGLLGVGWSISGLSAVTRCPRTLPQDGVKGGVAYGPNDRFCLDGQRLMLVTGTGSYGLAGSEYRTELDSFSKVVANGAAAGGGPNYFVVKTKSGLTMEYGNSTDSKIEVVGKSPSVVRSWALNKVTDTKGNTLTVSYLKAINPSTGAFIGGYYPDHIDYTSNPSTGLAATNSVVFSYSTTRPDSLVSYENGYSITSNRLLTGIVTKTNGANVYSYTLAYQTSPNSRRQRLTSVTLCPASGPCMPVTSAAFAAEATTTFTPVLGHMTSDTGLTNGLYHVIDINGDGKADLLHLTTNPGDYRVWLSNGDGTFSISAYNTGDGSGFGDGKWLLLDFNNDGRTDLVQMTTNPGDYRIWLSNANGTFTILNRNTMDGSALTNGTWLQLDVNGDGHIDLIQMTDNPGDYRVWINNGNGSFTITRRNTGDGQNLANGTWQLLDVNGDGLTDMIQMTTNPGDYRIWINNGNGTFTQSNRNTGDGQALANGFWQLLDLNGDGLTDMVQMTTNAGDYRVWMNKGDGTFTYTMRNTGDGSALNDGYWHMTDLNGDGLMDMVQYTTNLGDVRMWKSNGDGTFVITRYVSSQDTNYQAGPVKVGDFRGDGYADLIHLADDNGSYYNWNLTRVTKDVPSSISNGMGRNVSWTLDTLPRMLGTSYVKDVADTPTTLTIVPTMSVVSTVDATNGVGGTRRTTYGYGSARTERNGRGFLGFNWMGSIDNAASQTLYARTYYRQDFPFTGMVDRTGQGVGTFTNVINGNWSNLSLTTNQYGCFIPSDPPISDPSATMSTACSVAPSTRYFVYTSQTDIVSYDLNGALLPRSRTQNSNPDQFGNMKNVVTQTLGTDGSTTDYSKTVTNTYYNDVSNWYLGRLTRSTVAASGPTVPTAVIPGSGGLPPAPAPTLSPQLLSVILSLLLDD